MFKSMSRVGVSWAAAGALALLCTLPALAADSSQSADKKAGPMPPAFSDIDTNHDGVISAAEFEAFKPKPPEGGPAGDGAALPPPHGGPDMPPPGGHEGGPGGRRGPDLTTLDTNKDGKVSFEEFSAPMKAHFTAMDTNKDGFLDEAELKTPPSPEGGMDGRGPPPPEK